MNFENKKTSVHTNFFALFIHFSLTVISTQDMIEAENILIRANGRPDFPELPFDIIIA